MARYEFPFENLDTPELCRLFLDDHQIHVYDLAYLELEIFENNPTEINRFLLDQDPDLNYLMEQFDCKCEYYTEDKFTSSFISNANSLSVFHMNSRSLVKHFREIELFMSNIKYNFTFIGFSETWLKSSNVDCYNITNYCHEFDVRTIKNGGGVSLYILSQCPNT